MDGKATLNYVVEGKPFNDPMQKLFFEMDSGCSCLEHGAEVAPPHDGEPSVVDAERGARRATLQTFSRRSRTASIVCRLSPIEGIHLRRWTRPPGERLRSDREDGPKPKPTNAMLPR